jgi:ABC-2 type transport system permease protein
MSFVMWPMFMLSGALFPVENLPSYIDIVVKVNPLTYGVDLMRLALLGTTKFGPLFDIGVLVFATLVFIFIGTRSFEKMQV